MSRPSHKFDLLKLLEYDEPRDVKKLALLLYKYIDDKGEGRVRNMIYQLRQEGWFIFKGPGSQGYILPSEYQQEIIREAKIKYPDGPPRFITPSHLKLLVEC